MRHTRAHTKNRRSHHALTGLRLTVAKAEGVVRPRHRALLDGSLYRGRSVMDIVTRRFQKRQKQQEGASTEKAVQEEKAVAVETKKTPVAKKKEKDTNEPSAK